MRLCAIRCVDAHRRLSYEQGGGSEPSAPTSPKGKESSSFRLPNLAWLCVGLSLLRNWGIPLRLHTHYRRESISVIIHNIPFARRQTLGNDGGMWGSTWSAVLPDSLSG